MFVRLDLLIDFSFRWPEENYFLVLLPFSGSPSCVEQEELGQLGFVGAGDCHYCLTSTSEATPSRYHFHPLNLLSFVYF